MAEKTDQQLQDMFARPADWSPQALDAARAELQKRNVSPVEIASQPANDELLSLASRMYTLDEEARLLLTAELERRSIGPNEIQSYIDAQAAISTSPIKEIPDRQPSTIARKLSRIFVLCALAVPILTVVMNAREQVPVVDPATEHVIGYESMPFSVRYFEWGIVNGLARSPFDRSLDRWLGYYFASGARKLLDITNPTPFMITVGFLVIAWMTKRRVSASGTDVRS